MRFVALNSHMITCRDKGRGWTRGTQQRGRGRAIRSTAQQTAQVTLNTGSDCQLAVAFYPMFAYDASDGAVTGSSTPGEHNRTLLKFDPAQTYIPPLDWTTTRVLGLPIPPPLRIEISTKELSGWIDRESGEAELTFDALFTFTAGPIYRPPALQVKTILSTQAAMGNFQSAEGERFQVQGSALKGKLVGIAQVPKTGDYILDTFLQLPSEAFACLTAELEGV